MRFFFRGKRCDNGEWVQGYYIRASHHWHKHGIHNDWIALGASANGGWFALHSKYAVKDETVGQFAGLTDKNGKKIFEGDIVKRVGDKCVVKWIEEDAKFIIIGAMTKLDFSLCFAKHLEVIGNIHDNPELLETP